MTKDDIVLMAREAGFEGMTDHPALMRFANLVAAHKAMEQPGQEPTPWRDMVVVSLVREGINKHKARELADHFAAQPVQEPVGEVVEVNNDGFKCEFSQHLAVGAKLYTTPPLPVQEPWGACVSGRVFVGALPAHVRKLTEDEGAPIQWLYTTPPAAQQAEPLEYWNAVEGWVKIDEVREHFEAVNCGTIYKHGGEGRVPLYTAPAQRPWQGLTEFQFAEIYNKWNDSNGSTPWGLYHAIEKALKAKNHG